LRFSKKEQRKPEQNNKTSHEIRAGNAASTVGTKNSLIKRKL
jgi:hypothetical protein